MTGQTIRLHRVLRGTPDRLYRAFTDPDAMVKWLPPFGFTATMHDWMRTRPCEMNTQNEAT